MGKAKDILVRPIKASIANDVVKRLHYSGKNVVNSQLHFGVFFNNRLEGVMQFGPPINKKGTLNMVRDTAWNGMLELNRMAFSELLPRNSESRAISIALKLIRRHYPHIEWVLSFADASQCGDGCIYRASGFILTAIKKTNSLRINPSDGKVIHTIQAYHLLMTEEFKTWESLAGYQLRYIYFLNKTARDRLAVPILPFSEIDVVGAGMYKGESKRAKGQA